jgi:hypothetical protein
VLKKQVIKTYPGTNETAAFLIFIDIRDVNIMVVRGKNLHAVGRNFIGHSRKVG